MFHNNCVHKTPLNSIKSMHYIELLVAFEMDTCYNVVSYIGIYFQLLSNYVSWFQLLVTGLLWIQTFGKFTLKSLIYSEKGQNTFHVFRNNQLLSRMADCYFEL